MFEIQTYSIHLQIVHACSLINRLDLCYLVCLDCLATVIVCTPIVVDNEYAKYVCSIMYVA